MSTNKGEKLNRLLQKIPAGTVVLSSWLVRQGYSHDLQQKYIRSQWITPIGRGAYKRTGDELTIYGGVYALEKQANKNVHIGGLSALNLQGYAHYIAMYEKPVQLYANEKFKLPSWFKNYNWTTPYTIKTTRLAAPDYALIPYKFIAYELNITSPPQAMLQCLDMTPDEMDMEQAWYLMESMNNLVPAQIQKLLEQNPSIKAKRLFLFFAEKARHSWFKYLDITKIELGSGKRSIVKNGAYINKYKITVPKTLL